MTIRLYFDEDSMQHALVNALRARGIDVLTALEAQRIERSDEDHLDFATATGPCVVQFQRWGFLSTPYKLHGAEQISCRHRSCLAATV